MPAFRSDILLSHLLLIHNLSPDWIYRISPPLWNVAVEWQIYFFLPLLLLPLWRRFGLQWTVATALVLGLLPQFLLPFGRNGDQTYPWYLGLFTFGMAAAVVNVSSEERFVNLRARVPWRTISLVQLVLALGLSKWWWHNGAWFADILIGSLTATTLIHCTTRAEHPGSTEIGTVGQVDYRVRSVITHEYFHLWNVKRIRPFVLGPFDYVDPPRTRNLWWSEGVTSYYGDLLSRRAGLNTEAEYLKHVGDTITELQNNPARLKVSADESSLRVFDVNNSQGYGGLSYYTKGELVGLCLDLKIRQVTGDRHSLDDVMRALWTPVRHGDGPGFGEDDIKKAVNRVSGHDLSDYYDAVARGTDELPFAECLGYAGLTLKRAETPTAVAFLGMSMRPAREFKALMINDVDPGGAAAKAGLKPGDEITAANGQTELRSIFQLMRGSSPGKTINLTILRGGVQSDVTYTVGSADHYPYTIEVNPSATPEQVRLRQQWLTGN